ncbi:hypothetical protein GGQ99_000984 [Aminobacter niigataensis]|uniref:Uncharacterized protein n=1 Tax=Aminobacter niigataensis TaxID=83265 RepID=A0ABR6KXM1_9HYPH|nr:hypothetical protein [Aminobacter niigataensis]MBB4649262.1 hypothetical protein [Aminobacter niigataensis]
MKSITVAVDVANLAAGAGPRGHFRRVVGLLDDRQTVAIATMVSGQAVAEHELSFRLDDGLRLAEAVLAGDRRAMTQPGLARTLSATAALLFRVSHAAGAFQTIEGFDGDAEYRGDRGQETGDEHSQD